MKKKYIRITTLILAISLIFSLSFPSTAEAAKLSRQEKKAKSTVSSYLKCVKNYNMGKKVDKYKKGNLGVLFWKESYPLQAVCKSKLKSGFQYKIYKAKKKGRCVTVEARITYPNAYNAAWNALDSTRDYIFDNPEISDASLEQYMYTVIAQNINGDQGVVSQTENVVFKLKKVKGKWKIYSVSDNFKHMMTLNVDTAIFNWAAQYGV